MSTYLGNESLSPAVKERVLSTFQQTLALYKQGRMEEVVAGCGLILRMDPQFDPARKLLDKSRNPQLPIDVDKLGPAAPPPGASDPLGDARRALASRDFQRTINITTEILTDDLMNDEARILNEQARERMEAGPFVEQFARKCEQHLANKNLAAARMDMEKARALDPDHPALKRIEQMIAGVPQAAPPAASYSFDAPSPSFVVDTPQAPPQGRSTAQAADFGFTFEEEKPASPPPASSFGGGFSFDSPAAPAPAPPPPPKPAAPPANDSPFGGFSFDSPSAPPPSGGDALSNFSFESPKPAAPPPAAPASGFSFDAPAAAPSSGFSFDSPSSFSPPSSAPSADAPRTFDFATAPTEMSADDQKKIDQYLGEGDHAAEIGDYQKAIDLWSRIFLIDVTNEHASERIERAKVKRREIESRVETIVAAGTAAYERNDTDAARSKFLEALRVDPGNVAAQEGLERVSGTALEGGAAGFEAPYTPPAAKHDLFDDDLSGSYDDVLTPPEPAAPAPAPVKGKATGKTKAAAPTASAAPKRSSMTLIATVLAVVVLAGGGYFAYTKFFAKPAIDTAATQATFTKAEQLAKKGKYDQAIGMLQDVKLEDPMHDKAVLMISDLQHRKQQASEMIDGKPAAVYYQENLANGKTAYDTHDYEGAKKAWDLATRVKPLSPEMLALYSTAAQQAAKLDSAKALFKEAKYQDAILNLEPLLQQDPQNQNIQRMISDAHFNLGAAALGDERLPDAMTQFEEVLKANPNDELAKRSRDLAVRYAAQPKGTPKDLLYKIYVKYLPVRKVS